ncbi:LOW QUALITY PROTEIN: WD repeat-containing protein 81-like [Paramacrobiotus metropolitanus]|uniref:LOW QUALITY PROTEIN: WD repeat-containing protein 81-like n=1 Tax=Paramacrobiotus metropolitanus TaxID=2943436 RepID=UPI0024460A26|nr:LOW QUALITY PROTEIN: WD repeat-containing protein 81-like [Paramacrobiotus metropolitanus]
MSNCTFPEIDLCIPKSHIRILDSDIFHNAHSDGDNPPTRCLCLVQEEWLLHLVASNTRRACFQDAPVLPELSDIEVELLLSQPPVAASGTGRIHAKDGTEWIFVEMFYVPLLPSASVQRFPEMIENGDGTEDNYFSRISAMQGEAQNAAVLRKHPKSIQAVIAPLPQPVYEMAGDIVAEVCQSVLSCPFLDFSGRASIVPPATPPNILRPYFVACMVDHFLVALPYRPFTIIDCLRFSSNLLACDAAKYFILYQCIQAVAAVQRKGFLAGNVGLTDFVVRHDMWLEMKPIRLFEELIRLVIKDESAGEEETKRKEDPEDVDAGKISEWTTLWCLGKITNFEYLLALNRAAGRCFGHPDYHPIMPWVVDFSSSTEGYRDLTRSKYRLTKGDHQLDLTYQASDNGMLAHHIPETFSDLTFYIYKARRIPKSVLCQHVRKRWVPAEYPSTMERLYRWSCDECIPEFFSDPTIFQSIHPDLPDLAVPPWCPDVRAFLQFHRAALESDYVSQHLHHWIDLNFGYKLTGKEAIEAKNVVLSMHLPPRGLKNHGIQQLFAVAHPAKFRVLPWFAREPIPLIKVSAKGMKRRSSGDNLSVGKEDSGDDVSVDNVEMALPIENGNMCETLSPLEHLENLEVLIDFCISVDKEQPKLLDDFVPPLKQPETVLYYLRNDLQSVTCLAVDIFASSHMPHYFPSFSVLSKRVAYTKKTFAAVENKLPAELGGAVRALLSSKVFPYGAEQILADCERILPFPRYMQKFHQYAATIALTADHSILSEVLDDMDECDRELAFTFLKQLFSQSSEPHQWLVVLSDTVMKYCGVDRFGEMLLPLIQQVYGEGPPADKADYHAYVQLFQPEFLQSVAVRLGMGVFLRVWLVPLIEKLADVEEMLQRTGKTGHSVPVEEEQIFTLDDDDNGGVLDNVMVDAPDIVQTHVMSSLNWLAEEIGPVLTSRFISGNLLKSLSLCYSEQEKLQPVQLDVGQNEDLISPIIVAGDVAAWGVSQVLMDIASLYGRSFIWDHYFSYCAELVKEALRKLTPMNEAGLLGCLEMMQQILPQVTEAALYEHLPFQIINEILYPHVELLTSGLHIFPSGVATRRLLTLKWLNLVYTLASRIGRESARTMITSPLLVTFFGVFTKLYSAQPTSPTPPDGIPVPGRKSPNRDPPPDPHGSPFITIKKDQSSGELTVGTPVTLSLDSALSPPSTAPFHSSDGEETLQELKAVFTDEMASDAYIPFCALLGQFHMDEKLINSDFLHAMVVGSDEKPSISISGARLSRHNSGASTRSQRFGGEEAEVKGLRRQTSAVNASALDVDVIDYEESQAAEAKLLRDSQAGADRALRGNWLAYWQNEIGQDRRDEAWNVKQIPLQTFAAHAGSVKSLYVFDSEVSFMSGGKDKTVRLWSIRNTGDGNYSSTAAEGMYVDHKKPVTELKFMARERLAASCDGAVHLWDPWTVVTVYRPEVPTQATCMDTSSSPSSTLLIGYITDELCHVSRYDVRSKWGPCAGGQFKVSYGSAGLIRCLVTAPDNSWFACGFSAGVISVFDQRTGMMSATWKAHDSDIFQLLALSPTRLVSVASDNVVCVWDLTREPDERLVHKIAAFSEPLLQCGLAQRGHTADLVALLAGNRLGVVGDVLRGGTSLVTTKIRADVFKGNCVGLALLPMNRQLLVAGESGATLLLC